MSVNRPDNQTLYQMAEAELRKLPQFKNSIAPIPTYLIHEKINEFNRLKPEELQQKINEYFSSTENKPKGWAVFGLELSNKQNQNKPTQVTQYKSQNGKISPNDKNVREFAANLLLNNIVNANEKLENYRNGFGYISSDAVYHGLSNIGDWTWDALTGRDDFKGYHEKSNDLAKQKTMLQELTNLTSTKIEFEKKFKKIFGIDFDIEAFQNLQQASDNLNKLNTYEALSNRFKNSIDVINKNEGEFNFVSAMALVGPLFGNNMIKANEFVSNLEKDCSTDEEFKEKLIAVLSNAKNEADRNVAMISVKTPREHLEANYKQAYKNAMGDYHSSDDIDKFIENSQRNTMYTEMAIIIASSTLTMGSSAVQGLGAKAVTKFGAKAGGHIFKAGMTAATASLSSVETVVSGLTSKDGLTSAKLSEAGEQLKSGLIFGAFGAYVSGPIGDKVVSLLKSNPNITSTIMQKAFSAVGFGTEITADALFELGLNGGDVKSLFAENATGEALGRFMNMILGGRAHHASKSLLDNISLKQDIDTDGKPKYSVIQDGKVVFETKDPNQIIAGVTSIVAEAQGLKIDDLDTKKQSAKQSTETIEITSQPLTRESVQEMKQSGRNVTTMPDGTVVEYINGKAVELGKIGEHPKTETTESQLETHIGKDEQELFEHKYPQLKRLDEISQNGQFFGLTMKEFGSKEAQKETGLYLDELLKQIPETTQDISTSSLKLEGDVILPDGTIISRKAIGNEKPIFDDKGWPIGSEPNDSKIVFWVRDTEGNEHIIPAYTKENTAKAKQIWNYMQTLQEIPRDDIVRAQQEVLDNINGNTVKSGKVEGNKQELETLTALDSGAMIKKTSTNPDIRVETDSSDVDTRSLGTMTRSNGDNTSITLIEKLNNAKTYEELQALKSELRDYQGDDKGTLFNFWKAKNDKAMIGEDISNIKFLVDSDNKNIKIEDVEQKFISLLDKNAWERLKITVTEENKNAFNAIAEFLQENIYSERYSSEFFTIINQITKHKDFISENADLFAGIITAKDNNGNRRLSKEFILEEVFSDDVTLEVLQRLNNAMQIKNGDDYRYSENDLLIILGEDGASYKSDEYQTPDNGFVAYQMSTKLNGEKELFNGSKKEIRDSKGKLLYIEEYRPSELEGKFNIVRTDANGKEIIVGLASHSVDGELSIIEKILFGADNTKTDYVYVESPNGRLSYSKITDVDGKILVENKVNFKRVDETHYKSIENGVAYNIEYKADKIIVTNSLGQSAEINIIPKSELDVEGNTTGVGISEELLPVIKQLSGSVLMSLDKIGLKSITLSRNCIVEDSAQYNFVENRIYISPEYANNVFVVLHELGHFVDYRTDIHSNQELLNIYNQELNVLINSGSIIEFSQMSYFTSLIHVNQGGAITEMIAETHAINNASNTDPRSESRGALLQQHFPKTYAKITELLNQAKLSDTPTDNVHTNGDTATGIVEQSKLSFEEDTNTKDHNNKIQDNPDNISTRPQIEEPTTISKSTNKPQIKGLDILTPSVEADALKLTGEILTREVPNPNKPGETMRVLTDEAETLVWKASEDLRENALKVENQIVGYMHDAGLGTSETLKHRSKSLQSLHDKIKNYLAENPNKTLDDAIRDVRDYVATRTINESSNVRNHPDVVELIEKGDLKSAMSKAVEIESEYVLASLKGIIDKMADGTANIMITRISNYMGEDGIPYFTEKQLDQLRTYAHDKGVDIPIISRVTDVNERASVGDVYSDDASTKIRKSGYTAFQMNFVTKDGDVFEWQYRGDKLNDFGEGEHVPYDLRTGKDIIGKDVILTDLYQPMKELLTNKDLMPDDLYKEYNAYLTAHYRYLREVELGFAEPNNPPKLPAGLDTRLRADNLVLLHNIAEKLKKGELTKDEALKQYNEGLIQNTTDNVTTESYRAQLKETSANASIDRHEAMMRLDRNKNKSTFETEQVIDVCKDKYGNIKNNLVILVEEMRQNNIKDEYIIDFIIKHKDVNGNICNDTLETDYKKLLENPDIYNN